MWLYWPQLCTIVRTRFRRKDEEACFIIGSCLHVDLNVFWPLNSLACSIVQHLQPSSIFDNSIYHCESFLRLLLNQMGWMGVYIGHTVFIYVCACVWFFFLFPFFFLTRWIVDCTVHVQQQINRLKSTLGHSLTSTDNDGGVISLAQL